MEKKIGIFAEPVKWMGTHWNTLKSRYGLAMLGVAMGLFISMPYAVPHHAGPSRSAQWAHRRHMVRSNRPHADHGRRDSYPGWTGGAGKLTQKEGPRGETDSTRHWHIICTQIVTIGAAALAAAFLVTEPEKALTNPMPTVNAVKLMCAGIITFAFGILLIAAGTTLFKSDGKHRRPRKGRNRLGVLRPRRNGSRHSPGGHIHHHDTAGDDVAAHRHPHRRHHGRDLDAPRGAGPGGHGPRRRSDPSSSRPHGAWTTAPEHSCRKARPAGQDRSEDGPAQTGEKDDHE